MPAAVAAVVATAAHQATPLLLVEQVEQVAAVTVDPPHGTALTVAQALALMELQVQAVAVAVVRTVPAHRFLARQMAAAEAAALELLCCAMRCLHRQHPTLPPDQTVVHRPSTTSLATKHSHSLALLQ